MWNWLWFNGREISFPLRYFLPELTHQFLLLGLKLLLLNHALIQKSFQIQ